jgi:hypothetical protein
VLASPTEINGSRFAGERLSERLFAIDYLALKLHVTEKYLLDWK